MPCQAYEAGPINVKPHLNKKKQLTISIVRLWATQLYFQDKKKTKEICIATFGITNLN